MKKWFVFAFIAAVAAAGVFYFTRSDKAAEISNAEALTAEQAEAVAYNFILDFISIAPPLSDRIAADRAFDSLSSAAKAGVKRETISADIAKFIGVQDVPDQGASVEDVRVESPTEAYLLVGLNYSGGRALRNIHLAAENGEWKVDRVSAPEEAERFEQEGNLARNNPGMKPGVWHLIYEKPGQPALAAELQFVGSSICAKGAENSTCEPAKLEAGQRAKVLGEKIKEGVIRVIRLELK